MGTENIKLGVCNVFFDDQDLGLTKGGVEVEVSTTTHEIMVDQYGETIVGELITGRNVSATVPLVETTLENVVRIMPGATLITDGVKATGTVTFSAAPANNDSVTVMGQVFTFKTIPTKPEHIPIPTTADDAAIALAGEIGGAVISVSAVVSAPGVVTITANDSGTASNGDITVTGTALASTPLAGGITPTKAKVNVPTGVNINLLAIAKKLVLRPVGTAGEDDFIIHKAAAPGAMSFTYNTSQERIYTAAFKGYVGSDSLLFSVGDETASE